MLRQVRTDMTKSGRFLVLGQFQNPARAARAAQPRGARRAPRALKNGKEVDASHKCHYRVRHFAAIFKTTNKSGLGRQLRDAPKSLREPVLALWRLAAARELA